MTDQSQREPDDARFWQRQVADFLIHDKLDAQNSDVEVSDEIEEQLWAFAEDRLTESEQQDLWNRLQEHPGAVGRLGQIYAAIEEVEPARGGSARAVWLRALPATGRVEPVGSSIIDLVIRAVADGLEVLRTTGRPAFASAATRDSDPQKHTTSCCMEFIVSGSTLQVTIDFVKPGEFMLTVIPTRFARPIVIDKLDLEILDAEGVRTHRIPFRNGRAQAFGLSAGHYQLDVQSADGRSKYSISVTIEDT